jgi:hypothetical protein
VLRGVGRASKQPTGWYIEACLSGILLCRRAKNEIRQCDDSDVIEFVRKRLRIEPDAKQIEVLVSASGRGILNCSRQWGKSTVAAAKAVHRAFTRKGQLQPEQSAPREIVFKYFFSEMKSILTPNP